MFETDTLTVKKNKYPVWVGRIKCTKPKKRYLDD